jgi:hypothetical protein
MSKMKCNYTKLDDSEDTPLFQVTPGKNCRLFPYLWTPECAQAYQSGMLNPQNNPYLCRAMGPVDAAQMYTGLPVNFQYTPAGQPKTCAKSATEEPRGPVEGLSPSLPDAMQQQGVRMAEGYCKNCGCGSKEDYSACDFTRKGRESIARCRKCPGKCRQGEFPNCEWSCRK